MSVDTKEEFKKFLLQTVDENLKQIFRERATYTIYQFLENNYFLKREEIPEDSFLTFFSLNIASFFE